MEIYQERRGAARRPVIPRSIFLDSGPKRNVMPSKIIDEDGCTN